MDLPDEALLEQFQKSKDPSHFATLFRRYQNRVYNAAYRILGNSDEAEEVVQDTYLKIHENLWRFRGQSSFAAWVFRIAHNNCMDMLRDKRRRRGLFKWSFDPQSAPEMDERAGQIGIISQIPDPDPDPATQLDVSEQGEVVARSLYQLPETQRAVIVLHCIEGFSYQEIAEIVGASTGTVRSRIHYGRQRLRELLEPYFSAQSVSPASR